jgi:molecular chaperone Hsp33
VLAADDQMAAGLLIQRMPAKEPSRVSGERNEDQIGRNEDFNRIAHLTATLTRAELLTLEADTLLHRLFWEERLLRYEPRRPRFACSCARERVAGMLRGLGREEVDSIVAERGEVEVGCEFCGRQYRFDAIDAARLFIPGADQPPALSAVN